MATTRKPKAGNAPRQAAPSAEKRPAKAAADVTAVVAKPAAPAKAAAPAKPAAAAKATKAPKLEKAEKAEKADKPRKPKLVRDSFTIPKAEYEVIEALKQRAARSGSPAKKSELLRAGIKALAAMGDAALLSALKAVPSIKTGRPAKA